MRKSRAISALAAEIAARARMVKNETTKTARMIWRLRLLDRLTGLGAEEGKRDEEED